MVLRLLITTNWCTCFSRVDMKLVPWSVSISWGKPTLEKNCAKQKAADFHLWISMEELRGTLLHNLLWPACKDSLSYFCQQERQCPSQGGQMGCQRQAVVGVELWRSFIRCYFALRATSTELTNISAQARPVIIRDADGNKFPWWLNGNFNCD